MNSNLAAKYVELKQHLASLENVAVAFSAGVDSTLLLAVAHEVLGGRAIAFTALSPAHPMREADAARAFCEQLGVEQIEFEAGELELEGFEQNPPDRCYVCKVHLFKEMQRRAHERGIDHVVEGSNTDDLNDYRPGRRALEELGIESPLLTCGCSKQDIRDLSHELGLPTWDKPSFACLYSRFAYGDLITIEKLRRVEDAEQALLDFGFKTVRVRISGAQGETARIELAPHDIRTIVEPPLCGEVVSALKALGFAYVAVDLQGYRTGSMNELL